jgi:hypothetical protein
VDGSLSPGAHGRVLLSRRSLQSSAPSPPCGEIQTGDESRGTFLEHRRQTDEMLLRLDRSRCYSPQKQARTARQGYSRWPINVFTSEDECKWMPSSKTKVYFSTSKSEQGRSITSGRRISPVTFADVPFSNNGGSPCYTCSRLEPHHRGCPGVAGYLRLMASAPRGKPGQTVSPWPSNRTDPWKLASYTQDRSGQKVRRPTPHSRCNFRGTDHLYADSRNGARPMVESFH